MTPREVIKKNMILDMTEIYYRHWHDNELSQDSYRNILRSAIDHFAASNRLFNPEVWNYYMRASDHALDILEKQILAEAKTRLNRRIDLENFLAAHNAYAERIRAHLAL